jgi:hypothetical protein
VRIPYLQQTAAVLSRQLDDPIEFTVIVPIVRLNLNRFQPYLGLLLAFEDVHVRRFVAVGAVEPKFVPLDFDGWHGGFLWKASEVEEFRPYVIATLEECLHIFYRG